MRVLLIHSDAQYLGGAEKMLGYYLEGLRTINCQPTVAIVPGSRVGEVIPTSVPRLWLPEKQQFSIRKLLRQAWHILKARREFPFDVAHGWTARDWELASTVGSLARRPAIGTLHDHPLARAISRSRRILMRACARRGLETVVCVSQAVSTACVRAHYPADKLTVIRNGLPGFGDMPERTVRPICRLGFLGVFTERKGLDVLFLMLDELARLSPVPWQAAVAGAAQDSAGEGLMAGIRARFDRKPWWRQVG